MYSRQQKAGKSPIDKLETKIALVKADFLKPGNNMKTQANFIRNEEKMAEL